jgi:hypothetical protein
VTLGSGEERAELVGGPDLDRLGLAASRALRPGGRVGSEQLFYVYSVCECLAKGAVDVRDGDR